MIHETSKSTQYKVWYTDPQIKDSEWVVFDKLEDAHRFVAGVTASGFGAYIETASK